CGRRPGHYCRVDRLRLLRRQAWTSAPRNCQWIARAKGVPRWTRNGAVRPPLSLCHRVWRGYGLFCGEARYSYFATARSRFWGSVWCGCLFLHESHRGAALRCRQASVFPEDDDHRRDHTHFLCWTSHIPSCAAILQMTVRQVVFERGLALGLLSYAA